MLFTMVEQLDHDEVGLMRPHGECRWAIPLEIL